MDSGKLTVGRITFQPRLIPGWVKWIDDYRKYCTPMPLPQPKQVEVDEMNHEYETKQIVVDKRTHRIRFEDETENQVTIIIEPK